MDEKLMVATEGLLRASLEKLFLTGANVLQRRQGSEEFWNFTLLMKLQQDPF
jgi:hypothetical protein